MLSKTEQKVIKSLKVKKYRTREKKFLVEGEKNVLELLHSDFETILIVSSKMFFSKYQNDIKNIKNEIVTPTILEQLGTFKTNSDVIAVAKMKPIKALSQNHYKDILFVADRINDPGNFGTIIRTLDWFGFKELICSEDSADFYHPKVINSSMGSFTRVKVYQENLNEWYENLNMPIYGMDTDGVSIYDTSIKTPCVIVLGNESHGLSSITRKYLSKSISIPSIGNAESLNVGVTAGIIANHLRTVVNG